MSDDDSVIYSDDFTRVFAYQSRQFTIGDLSLRRVNGVQWDAFFPALAAAGAMTLLVVVVLLIVGISVWWGLLVFLLPMLVGYARLAKERGAGLTETEKLFLRAHFRFRQPRRFIGFSSDTEPNSITWDTILWSPTPPSVAPAASS